MGLTKFEIYRPLPKKILFEKEEKNIGCFFDYKKYVNINKVCENLLSLDNENLYLSLAIFSKNHYQYRDTLYYNLQDLTIGCVTDPRFSGFYILTKVDNVIGYEGIDASYHELLHCSSSSIDKQNDILYSGFGYYDFKRNIDFGEGITDGYIEVLLNRDMYNDKVVYDYNLETDSYKIDYFYVNAIARQLEIIVGKEKLESMFFKDGFSRLKEFLMQYRSEKEVMKFFKNCDAAAIAGEHRNVILNKKTLDAQKFLNDICDEYMPEKKPLLIKENLIKENDIGTKLITGRVYEEINIIRENRKKK